MTNFEKSQFSTIFSNVLTFTTILNNFLPTFSPFLLILNNYNSALYRFNVGNGPAEDVEAEHDLEFQFALFQEDQSDLDFLKP